MDIIESRKEKSKLRRGIYILPNLFTISSIFAGFYAIISAMNGIYDDAAIAIFIAMIMDGLDGRVARITNTQSAFGAELDSLADMVSFGIAPASVIYCWILSDFGKIGWLAAFIFAVSVALRLARFNTQIGKEDKRYSQGLASTAAAGVIASLVWVGDDLGWDGKFIGIGSMLLVILLSLLMVSNIRYHSFKDFNLKNNVSFFTILIMVLALVLIAFATSKILFAIFFLYALSAPILNLHQLRKKLQEKRKRVHGPKST